jgi:hypothetical protein
MNGEDKHGEASAEIAEHPEELPMSSLIISW